MVQDNFVHITEDDRHLSIEKLRAALTESDGSQWSLLQYA